MPDIFSTIFTRIVPLYAYILVGFYAARYVKIERHGIAKLLLYIISPIVVFLGTLNVGLSLETIFLAFLVCIIASILSITYLKIGKLRFKNDSSVNLLAYAAGAANTGYFGLPVIAAVLGEQAFATAVVANLGMIFFEMTLGFYLAAKGNFTASDSLRKLIKLPHIYALLAAASLQFFDVKMNAPLESIFSQVKECYSVLGMLIIGMALANLSIKLKQFEFCLIALSAKFIAAPILALIAIQIDAHYYMLLSQEGSAILLLLSSTPLAANTVVVAHELDLSAELAAFAVILSTLVALFFIPMIETLRMYKLFAG